MELNEVTLSSSTKFHGKILYVTQDEAKLPNGETALRDVVHHSGGVGVLPLTDKNTILMVRQFRYPMHKVTLEIPAGKREKDEEPLECGVRELLEETGNTADKYTDLGIIYPTPAYDTEQIYIYLATGLHSKGTQSLDEDEFVNVEEVPFEKALEMVMSGEIKDAKTVAAVLKTAILLKK